MRILAYFLANVSLVHMDIVVARMHTQNAPACSSLALAVAFLSFCGFSLSLFSTAPLLKGPALRLESQDLP